MASGSAVAQYVELLQRNKLGVSVSRLQKLSATDLDTVITELKAGSNNNRYRVGGYTGPEGLLSATLMVNQELWVTPLQIDNFFVASEIGIENTVAGTEGNLYACIYADNGYGFPGTLVATTTAQVVTGTSFKSQAALTVPIVPGLYWVGALVNGVITTAPTIRTVNHNSKYVGSAAGAGSTALAGYKATALAAAPPTTFPAAVSVIANAPRVMIGVGAI